MVGISLCQWDCIGDGMVGILADGMEGITVAGMEGMAADGTAAAVADGMGAAVTTVNPFAVNCGAFQLADASF